MCVQGEGGRADAAKGASPSDGGTGAALTAPVEAEDALEGDDHVPVVGLTFVR